MVQGCTSIVGKSDKEGKKGERKKGGRQCKNFTPAQTKNEGRGMWVRAVIGSVKAVANRQVNS